MLGGSNQRRSRSCSRQGRYLTCHVIFCSLDRILTQQAPGTFKDASDSLTELITLSKKLAAVRGPPRVIGVQGAAQLSQVNSVRASHGGAGGVSIGGHNNTDSAGVVRSSSASATWQAQQVINARLESEWREGQGRAAKALTSLLGSGAGGAFGYVQQPRHFFMAMYKVCAHFTLS